MFTKLTGELHSSRRKRAIKKSGAVNMKEIADGRINTTIFRREGFVACGLQSMEYSIELDRKQQSKSDSHGAAPS